MADQHVGLRKSDAMAQEETIQKQGFIKRLQGFKLPSLSLLELAFLCLGLMLTVAACLSVNVFLKRLIHDEYDRITQDTVEVLVKGFAGLENSLDTMATIFTLSEDADEILINQEKRRSIPHAEHFDQILMIYQSQPSQWQFKNIRMDELSILKNFDSYKIEINRDFLAHVLREEYFSDDRVKILRDPSFFVLKARGSFHDVYAQPFAFIRPVDFRNPAAGVIAAVTNAASILNDSWLRDHPLVSRILIRDVESGKEVYGFSHKEASQSIDYGDGQIYEFDIGGRKWDVRLSFFKEQKVYLLEKLPLFILLFGLSLSLIGASYVRNNQKQSWQMRRMNETLEQKNQELNEEISKRAYLNEFLVRSERENRAIIDAVSDVIFETDIDGKILFLNNTWEKVTGFEIEQSKGMDLFKMLHPQDQEEQRRSFNKFVNGQKEAYRNVTRLRTSRGTFRSIEIAVSMVRRDESQNLRVVGTFTDVEERRRAEKALVEADKKYRAIVENAAGGIYQVTPEGIYLSANASLARILGYESPESLMRGVKNANEDIYAYARQREDFLIRLGAEKGAQSFETQALKKSGEKIWVNESVRAVYDDEGNVLYYEGAMEDITARKESEQALKEAKVHSDLANRAKSEFLANMSHELRTPLNAIIGFSEIIMKETFGKIDQEAYKEYALDIHNSGKNLLKIISEILDISKIEAHERHLKEDVLDLGAIVDSAVSLLRPKAVTRQLSLHNNIAELPKLIGEEVAIKQIFLNLLSNAIKFTPSGGSVTINGDVMDDGGVRISITDTGVGLTEEEVERALSPFGQLDNAMARDNGGTGLGLTLVDALVELHGGAFDLVSQKGIGTTASIIFPVERVMIGNDPVEVKKEIH